MRRIPRHWPWLVAILVGISAVLWLRKSESDRIRDELESIAEALRFEGRALEPVVLRKCLAKHVADPVTVSVAPLGESSFSTDLLVKGIIEYTSNLNALGITLSNIGVTTNANEHRATAKGEAHLDILEPTAERHGEPRKFAATLEQKPDGWVIVHAQIEAPRIDQPEARP
jgi:hypothetical protein